MTDKVLSQDEVDALLKGVASGEIGTEDAKEKYLKASIIMTLPARSASYEAGCQGLKWPMKVLPGCSELPYPISL